MIGITHISRFPTEAEHLKTWLITMGTRFLIPTCINDNSKIIIRHIIITDLFLKLRDLHESYDTLALYVPPKHSCSRRVSVISTGSTVVSLNLNHLPLFGFVNGSPLKWHLMLAMKKNMLLNKIHCKLW